MGVGVGVGGVGRERCRREEESGGGEEAGRLIIGFTVVQVRGLELGLEKCPDSRKMEPNR